MSALVIMVWATGRDGGQRAVMLDKIVQLADVSDGSTNIILTTGERINVSEDIRTLVGRINATERGAPAGGL